MDHDIEALQVIADYRKASVILRNAAKGSIFGGIVNTALGLLYLHRGGIINLVLVLMGLFMIVEGLWTTLKPTANGIILDGIVCLVVGIWNVLVTVLDYLWGFPPRFQWAVIGLFMIGFAIYRFFSYRHFSTVFSQRPSQQDLADMDDLINHIQEIETDTAEDMVEFEQKNFLQHQLWKGQLGTEAAVFVSKPAQESFRTRQEVLVAPRELIDFTVRRKLLLGKRLKASLRIGNRKMNVLIWPEFSQRLETWKALDPSVGKVI